MGKKINTMFFLLLLLLPTTITCLELIQPISYSYFNRSNTADCEFLGASSMNQGALQITPDTLNQELIYLVNKSGRVLFNQPFTLWSKEDSKIASFNTTFTVNIFRLSSTNPGEGFAFIIAPSLDDVPANSYGGYLGLTNQTLDRSDSNHIIAIELDNVKQTYDPDDNHVGLNINSVVSNATASLTPFGISIAPTKPTNYTIWIDYDGIAKHISFRMALEHTPKPTRAILESPLDVTLYALEKSYFGFSASTGITDIQLNCVLSWNLTIVNIAKEEHNRLKLVVGIVVPVVIVLLAAILGAVVYLAKRKKFGEVDPSVLEGTLKCLPGTPQEFEFKVLKKATNGFDEKMKLGQGGYGVVYRGVIPGENTVVAVKKFSRDDIKGQDDFLAELSIINRLRHKNLVRLLGWCHKNGMLLLVYEFMPNGSLDQHLYREPGLTTLTWAHRYNILSGVASALHYLHDEYDQVVVHRDLKASNVLLDSCFNARLGDFGLARAVDTDKTSYVDVDLGGVAGTMGYIAPECFHTGRATRHSDVYAFGAVILEVVCSRRPRVDIERFQFLVDWVWMLHREDRILEAVDGSLNSEFDKEEAERLLLLGLACSHPSATDRPKTSEVLQNISKSVPPVTVPMFKPSFVWPSVQFEEDEEGTTQSSVVVSPYYASSSGWNSRADADL